MKKTLFHTGRRWTDDEIKKLMRLWAEKKTVDEIVAEFDGKTTRYAISKMVVRLRKEGIPLERRRRGHQQGQRAGKPWTQSEIEFLARRRIEGATSEEIGVALGRTHHAIAAMIANLREQNVPIAMRGGGVRRLWNADTLRFALIESEPENVNVIRIDEKNQTAIARAKGGKT